MRFGTLARGLLAGGLLAGCGGGDAAPEPVRVGIAVPLTGSGPLEDARRAWGLVAEQIEQAGGVAGRELVIDELDTPLSRPDDLEPLARGFERLADSGHQYVISLISGATVDPVMESANARGVLAMSATAEESRRNLPEYQGMLLRAVLPTDRLIAEQAERMQQRGERRLAIVGPLDPGAIDPRSSAMRVAYEGCGECQLGEFTYASDADVWSYDWRSFGEGIVAAEPDAIFLTGTDPQALLDTVYATEAAGYAGLYHFAYGGFLGVVAGAFPNSDVDSRLRSHDLELPPGPELERFLSLYEQRHGETFSPEPRLAAFADYVVLLSLAIGQVGDADARRVAEEMRRIATPPGEPLGPLDYAEARLALDEGRDVDFQGLSGSLDFDERGDVSEGRIVEFGVSATGEIASR